MPAGAVDIGTDYLTDPTLMVPVVNAGNPADTHPNANRIGRGSVPYDFQIGKYEVTTAQYAKFLNAVAATDDPYDLYNNMMTSAGVAVPPPGIIKNQIASNSFEYTVVPGRENKPIYYVSFWSAARFCNWLTTGDTEHGIYELNGSKYPTNSSITRNSSYLNSNGNGWALPSADEWYKAAYYDPDKNNGTGGYWEYPMRSDTLNLSDANYAYSNNDVSVVDFYAITSYYGTYNQVGNVYEWDDTIYNNNNRGIRGGALGDSAANIGASSQTSIPPTNPLHSASGFRVVYLTAVPEPQTYALFGGMALLGLTLLRRRKK